MFTCVPQMRERERESHHRKFRLRCLRVFEGLGPQMTNNLGDVCVCRRGGGEEGGDYVCSVHPSRGVLKEAVKQEPGLTQQAV